MQQVKRLILLSAVLTVPYICWAQIKNILNKKKYPVKTINYKQGLLNNNTTDIVTDSLGFSWISTQTGMQRYNGYVLETVNPVINKTIVGINSPVYFFTLKNNKLWISYRKGVLEYNPNNNLFKKIISLNSPSNQNFSLIPVKQTEDGIWCLQRQVGLVLYSVNGVFLKKFPITDRSFIDNVFRNQDFFRNTRFDINKNSIFIYNGKDLIQQINFKTQHVNYIKTTSLDAFACSNTHLFTISSKELNSIDIKNKKVEKKFLLNKIAIDNITGSAIFFSDNNQLLIGLNNHLFAFDTSLNFTKEFVSLSQAPLLSQGYIRDIYTDRFNRIWLLTNDDIKRIQDVDIPFDHFIYPDEKNNFVRTLYYDKQNDLLLAGCFNGGIQLYDTLGNARWEKALIRENVKNVNAIDKLSGENYLIETFGRGWYILNSKSKKIRPFLFDDSIENEIHPRNINFINNLQRINDSTVYIATSANVFDCIFKKEKLKSAEPLLTFKNRPLVQINCFIYTSDKSLWVGTKTGTILEIRKNKKPKIFQLPENYQVRSFAEDMLKHVWIGTDKGLYIYSTEGKLIKKVTVKSGLLNDCIYAMLPVKNKQAVFASSNMGLSYIPLNGTIINYTKESGVQENEFNTGSATRSAGGKYYFGGINGITAFYPSSLSDIKDTPVINISNLVVNDVDYNFSPKTWRNDSIILNYNQNHLQLDIAALGLLSPKEYVYNYRIKGFEKKFQTTNQPTSIKYVLPPGKYLLQINCAPIFSSHSIFKKTFTIIIWPPWWETWWYRLLLIVVCISIVAIIVRQYLHRRYQKKLAALQLHHEIQEERERISRDLHDNLGAYAAAIASNVANIKNWVDVSNPSTLDQLKINSQSIISQLNDTIWALNKEAISLTAISDRFKIFLQKIEPNYPHINISIEEKISNDQELSPASALHLFRILQEGVNNALKHSEGNLIKILIESDKLWTIKISDNGKGIENKIQKTGNSNGLINMKTRAEKSGWAIVWQKNIPCGTNVIISSTTN